MNRDFYSNTELTKIKERLNREIQRRGTYRWWDPFVVPRVGEDRSPPLTLPATGEQIPVSDQTYTINNPSDGSIEPTRNMFYPAQGENPGGTVPNFRTSEPNTSGGQVNLDELKNFLVGLAKIQDVNLYYGRDEINYLAFRDPSGIEEALVAAENSPLNAPLMESDISPTKNDPNGGIETHKNPEFPVTHSVTYPIEDGAYIMPSGERDGEESGEANTLSEENFYDDHGAEPGDGSFHPYNPYISAYVHRDRRDQQETREDDPEIVMEGGIPSTRFGKNPRNPRQGDSYRSRPVFGGKIGSCNVACSGLCYTTCDNECSESCSTTCWNRCGEACTATCGNVCTGCTTMCYTSCKTKCENSSGYACLKAGAKAVKITAEGGHHGIPAKNTLIATTYSCQGCAYTCQFYPNKKTECWDAACMGKCFTSCTTSCSTSCFGGCVDNAYEGGKNYRTGHGRGCSGGCTLNCIGLCHGVCEGYCVQTCWHACKATCSDNCSWTCMTDCGSGCFQKCSTECTGCTSAADAATCKGGCSAICKHDCNSNCIGSGCRSICGVDSAGACEANCRINCTASSCTALCSDACSAQCSTCVNTCGWQCGACSSECSIGCGAECNITCTERCEHSCEGTCVHSCDELCGGCSNLCYSCVGKCIGTCSVKCEDGCSSCTNTCGWWCDSTCSRECMVSCSDRCIHTCSGSCSTYLESDTKATAGPERPPTANGFEYPNPKNRWEERESFKLFRDPPPYRPYKKDNKEYLVTITFDEDRNLKVIYRGEDGQYDESGCPCNCAPISAEVIKLIWENKYDKPITHEENVQYCREITAAVTRSLWYGEWVPEPDYSEGCHACQPIKPKVIQDLWEGKEVPVSSDNEGCDCTSENKGTWTGYVAKQTSIHGGVYNIDELTGEITVNMDMLPGLPESNQPNLDGGGGIFVVVIYYNEENPIKDEDIEVVLPIGFEALEFVHDKDNNTVVIIQRDVFLLPEDEEDKDGED